MSAILPGAGRQLTPCYSCSELSPLLRSRVHPVPRVDVTDAAQSKAGMGGRRERRGEGSDRLLSGVRATQCIQVRLRKTKGPPHETTLTQQFCRGRIRRGALQSVPGAGRRRGGLPRRRHPEARTRERRVRTSASKCDTQLPLSRCRHPTGATSRLLPLGLDAQMARWSGLPCAARVRSGGPGRRPKPGSA